MFVISQVLGRKILKVACTEVDLRTTMQVGTDTTAGSAAKLANTSGIYDYLLFLDAYFGLNSPYSFY